MTQPPADDKWSRLDWVQGSGPVAQPQSAKESGTPATVRRYVYRPRVLPIVFGFIFFGIGGLFLANEAMTNTRGLVINGLIHLNADWASIFYWCLTAVCFGFVAIAIFFALPQLFMKREIVIDDASITVPGWGFSTRAYRIEFRDISEISTKTSETRTQKFTYVKIHHIGGRNSINSGMLPNGNSDVDSILLILQGKLASQREPAITCANCGYSLRGNTTGVCPECGTSAQV